MPKEFGNDIPDTTPVTNGEQVNEGIKTKNKTSLLKLISTTILVIVILFSSYLAYIVLNPDQVEFLIKTFGIDPIIIDRILKNLSNWIFGILSCILSIYVIVLFFRGIITPMIHLRTKLFYLFGGLLLGILIFAVISFWAYVYSILTPRMTGHIYDDTTANYNNAPLEKQR